MAEVIQEGVKRAGLLIKKGQGMFLWASGSIRERLLSEQEEDANEKKPCDPAANTRNDYLVLTR